MGNFFIHKITVFHADATRTQFNGVYFRHNVGIAEIAKGVENASSGTITIPTTEDLSISEGDYVIEGLIDAEWNYRTLIQQYKIYKVDSVHDNRKGGLPHYKLEVKD